MSDEQEPYAWAVSGSIWLYDEYEAEAKAKRWGGSTEAFPLYRRPAPEGWRLVPVEPTPEMLAAAYGHMPHFTDDPEPVWAAMIAAAPSAPKEG